MIVKISLIVAHKVFCYSMTVVINNKQIVMIRMWRMKISTCLLLWIIFSQLNVMLPTHCHQDLNCTLTVYWQINKLKKINFVGVVTKKDFTRRRTAIVTPKSCKTIHITLLHYPHNCQGNRYHRFMSKLGIVLMCCCCWAVPIFDRRVRQTS